MAKLPPVKEAASPAQANQSLQHGIAILMQLAASNEPIGSRELARQLDMEPTHVNRLLGTLAYMGMARQNEARKYLPGDGIHILAALAIRGSQLLRVAREPLIQLAREARAKVSLGVLWGTQVCYLYHGVEEDIRQANITQGNLFPAEDSSIGRILLAARSAESVRAMYPGNELLVRELKKVRQQGYASGMYGSLSVMIGNGVAGLAVFHQPEGQTSPLIELLHNTAKSIEAALT